MYGVKHTIDYYLKKYVHLVMKNKTVGHKM